jgi:hypothetical protein
MKGFLNRHLFETAPLPSEFETLIDCTMLKVLQNVALNEWSTHIAVVGDWQVTLCHHGDDVKVVAVFFRRANGGH